jgi:UDP-N-acetylglucosamine acyltransferase
MGKIHPLAFVDKAAVVADGVEIGPFAVIGAGVEIGPDNEIGAGAQIEGPTRIGRENRIFPHATLGFEPQDLKFRGEEVRLEIGDRNQFREFATIHRGTAKGGALTRIGSDNLFMVYTHVAHDCTVGDGTVFANNATLAGHVEVHDGATISAFSAIHQFCRVGRQAYIGGYTVVTMDALPFVKTVGQKAACYGLNTIGLKRKGFSAEGIERLGRAVRLLTRAGLNVRQALSRIREEILAADADADADVSYLVEFVESAKRGVHRAQPRGGRSGENAADKPGPDAQGASPV